MPPPAPPALGGEKSGALPDDDQRAVGRNPDRDDADAKRNGGRVVFSTALFCVALGVYAVVQAFVPAQAASTATASSLPVFGVLVASVKAVVWSWLLAWYPWLIGAAFLTFMVSQVLLADVAKRPRKKHQDKPYGEKESGGVGGRLVDAVRAATSRAEIKTPAKAKRKEPTFDPRRIAAMEQALGSILMQNKLYVEVLEDIDGPQVITWVLRLTRNQTTGLKTIKQLSEAIAMQMGVSGVRVTLDAGRILVEAPKPESSCWTPNGIKLAEASAPGEILVGVDSWGEARGIRLADHGALMWVGGSQRGKTSSMLSALYSVIRNHPGARFLIFCQEGKRQKDWGVLEGVRGNLGIVTDYKEMPEAMAWIEADCQARGYTDGPTIIIVDDVTALPTSEIGKSMGEIAVTGAAYGYSLWLGTHLVGSNEATGNRKIEAVATAKILFQMGSGNVASGLGKLETTGVMGLSSNKGDAIMENDGAYTRIATAYLPEGAFAFANRGAQPTMPWRKVAEPPAEREVELVPEWNHVEPPRNQVELGGTRWNHPDPPPETGLTVVPNGGGVSGSTGGSTGGSLPYSSLTWTDFLEEYQGGAYEFFPLFEVRDLSPAEAMEAQRLHENGFSKNQLYKLIFAKYEDGEIKEGKKGRSTHQKLEAALAFVPTE